MVCISRGAWVAKDTPACARQGHSPTPARPGWPHRPLSEALPPPSRCDRVLAGLRTVKLIVPAGSGERGEEGSGESPRLPLGPVPSGAKVGILCPPSRLCPRLGCPRCRHRCPLLPRISRLLSRVHRNALQVRRQSVGPRQRHGKYCWLNSRLYLSSTAPLGVIGQTHNKTQK